MWDELARGSVGAVVLVDLRRIDDCFPAIDFFENRRLPFVVGVNRFPEADEYDPETVRDALALSSDTPIVWMDARDPHSSRAALVKLVEHALARTAVARAG
jgi:signal recognition particle receptor subunit beta